MHNFRPFTTKCAVTFAGFCLFCGPLQQITLFFSGIIGGNSLAINFGLQSTMAELLGEMAEIPWKRSDFLLPEKGSGKLCRSTLVTWYIVFFDLPKQNSQELLFSFLVVSAKAACDNMETIKIHIHASRLMKFIYRAHASLQVYTYMISLGFGPIFGYDISSIVPYSSIIFTHVWLSLGFGYLFTIWIWVPYGVPYGSQLSQLLMPWIARILAGRWDGHLAASNHIYTCNMM